MSKRPFSKRRLIVTAVLASLLAFLSFLLYIDRLFGMSRQDVMKGLGLASFSHSADGYDLTVHFIDVGKGDSVLICCGGKNVLIDSGSPTLDCRAGRYLQSLGIEHIDLFAASYTDEEHIGDFSLIAGRYTIGSVMLSPYESRVPTAYTAVQKDFYGSIDSHGIPVLPSDTTGIMIGEARLSVLSPKEHYTFLRNNSLVLRLDYKDVSFLLAGDIGKTPEKDLLEQGIAPADVYKMSDRDDGGGTCDEFFEMISPKYTVLSVGGSQNVSRGAFETAAKSPEGYFRTDRDGTVIFASDGRNITVFREKGQ